MHFFLPAPRRHSFPGAPALVRLLVPGLLFCAVSGLFAQESLTPEGYLDYLKDQFYLEAIDDPFKGDVRYHLVPLGAVQKVYGKWSPRESERVTGHREAYSWQITEGFTVRDVVADLDARLADDAGATTLFRCEGISCGSSVQWANSIFNERLLYGTQDSQRYRAYALRAGEDDYRLLVYGAARTVDRQYLHVELLRVEATR
jgi:hypothetical protein